MDEATNNEPSEELESADAADAADSLGSRVEPVLDGNEVRPGDQRNLGDKGSENDEAGNASGGENEGLNSNDKINEPAVDIHGEDSGGITDKEEPNDTDPESKLGGDTKDDVSSEPDSDYEQEYEQNAHADISEAKPRYELTHWMYHLREAERLWTLEEREKSGEWAKLWGLVDKFLFESPATFIRWQYTAWAPVYFFPGMFDADSLGDPIHIAASYGLTVLVERILDRGVDVNSRNGDKVSALHLAAVTQEPSTVELLLKRGADVHLQDCSHCTALWRVVSKLNGNAKIAKLLLEGGSEPGVPGWFRATPLHFACLNGNFEIFKLLVDSGVDVKAKDDIGESPLHYALKREPQLELIKELIRLGADVNEQDNNSQAPLFVAVAGSCSGNTAIVNLLLDSGADVDDDDVFGFTALHCAAINGNFELLVLLAERGASLTLRDKNGNSALSYAAQNGRTDIVKYLLQRFAAQENESCITAVDIRGRRALHRAAAKGHEDIVEMLLAAEKVNSAPPAPGNIVRATPLHAAAHQGHEMVVRVLLKNGDDVKAQNRLGETPIDLALKAWARGTACHEGAFNCLVCMINTTPEITIINRSLLHIAARKGSDSMVRKLLELGADPNGIDEHGWTPILVALQYDRPTIVEILKSHGLDPDLPHGRGSDTRIGKPPTLWLDSVLSPIGISEDGTELHYAGTPYPSANIMGTTS